MANREKGEVEIVIGGQPYTLVLNTNAIVALENQLSSPERDVVLSDVLSSMAVGSQRYTRAFFWACLRQFHRQVTIDQAGDLMDVAGGSAAIFMQLAALQRSAHPDPEDRETLKKRDPKDPRTPRRNRGTGAAATSTRGASG